MAFAADVIDVVDLAPLTERELTGCAADMLQETNGEWLDAREIARAANSYPYPGYVRMVVQIANDAKSDDWKAWAGRGPASLAEGYVHQLLQGAPFSEAICYLFLGLCLVPDAGVSDAEFLAICQPSDRFRSELEDHFPQSRFTVRVPQLVWHRLTQHFDPLIEQSFRAGGLAWLVREQFSDAIRQRIGADCGRGSFAAS
jgi:hypothetical protein